MNTQQFLPNTIDYLKNNTEFIPPKNSRDILIKHIKPFINCDSNILEPCAKTGEFVNQLLQLDISFNLTILEENKDLLDNINDTYLIHNSFNTSLLKLSQPHNFKKFDIILGAPPSKLIDKKTTIGKSFRHWFIDNTNLYSLYFMRAIDLIYQDGIIAFIIPDTILNSPNIQMLRNKISKRGSVIHLQRLSNLFTRTTFNTVLIVFQKNKNNQDKYKFSINNQPFFHPNPQIYKDIFLSSTFLSNINCKITKGLVHRNIDNRTSRSSDIPILYSKNIDSDYSLRLFNNKKQYINHEFIDTTVMTKPSLIFSKFYGTDKDEFQLKCAPCTLEKYICHDNLFIVTFPNLDNEKSIILIYKIIKSIQSDKTKVWQKNFLKNGILTKFQIKYYLPIFL